MMLLVSDYDRTLKIDDQISQNNREAIAKFRALGHKFCINSGRSYHFLMQNLKIQNFDDYDYIITGSGSQIVDRNGCFIDQEIMDKNEAVRLIETIQKQDVMLIQLTSEKLWKSIKVDDLEWKHATDGFDLHRINSISTRFSEEEPASRFAQIINNDFKLNAFANKFSVDVAPVGISKATAVSKLGNHIEVDYDAIHTIGDSLNDLEMIQEYNGYCVKVSHPKVVEVSKKMYEDVAACIEDLINQ